MSTLEPRRLFDVPTQSSTLGLDPQSPAPCVPLHMAIPDLDESGQQDAPAQSAAQTLTNTERELRQRASVTQRTLEDERARYVEAVQKLVELRTRFVQETQNETVQLALHIAKQVIANDANLRADFAGAMARVALDGMRETLSITLRVAPADAAMLRRTLAASDPTSGQSVHVVEDPSLSDGGIVATCEGARFDADVRQRLKVIEQQLLAESKRAKDV